MKIKSATEVIKKAGEKIKGHYLPLALSHKGLFAAGGAIVFMIVVYSIVLITGRYSLNSGISGISEMIPEDAVLYGEVRSVSRLREDFTGSSFGKTLLSNEAWNNLIYAYNSKINSVFYFLGLKTGFSGSYSDILTLVDGRAGFALFPGDKWVTILQANVKSKIGAALVSAFKSEDVELSPDPVPDGKGEKKEEANDGTKPATFSDALPETKINLSNLRASRIELGGIAVYFVLLEDYLFISNDTGKLKDALGLAGSPGGISDLTGFKMAKQDFDAQDSFALVYMDHENSLTAPLFHAGLSGEGTVFVLKGGAQETLTGNIYVLGYDKPSAGESASSPDFEKYIPSDITAAWISRNRSVPDVMESVQTLGNEWKTFKSGMENFFSSSGLSISEGLKSSSGVAMVLHDFRYAGDKMVPDFSFLYGSKKPDQSLIRSIFKTGDSQKENFQNVDYEIVKNASSFYYQPSRYFRENIEIQTSATDTMKKMISAGNGNSPVLGDEGSQGLIGEFKNSSFGIYINLQKLSENLISFYGYGVKKDERYTEKTIENDIRPLFEPLNKYRYLQIGITEGKIPAGKIVISEKR